MKRNNKYQMKLTKTCRNCHEMKALKYFKKISKTKQHYAKYCNECASQLALLNNQGLPKTLLKENLNRKRMQQGLRQPGPIMTEKDRTTLLFKKSQKSK